MTYRSRLTFDVSFLPRGTVINRAALSIDTAPNATLLTSFTGDTALAAHVGLSSDPSFHESGSAVLLPTSNTLTTFTGDISHAVQYWVRGPNYGLVLRCTLPSENSSLDLYGLRGVRWPDVASRPRLKIIYSFGQQ